MTMNTTETTNTSAPDSGRVRENALSRQQLRHARQIVEYHRAVAAQGKRFVVGLHDNPIGPSHVGAKQRAKLAKKSVPSIT